jgi:NAD(P)-dependent dehydrogenase (short-subunit alcohol dehydrogenase family)
VTGASRGIGREVVASVVLTARDPERSEKAAAERATEGLDVVGRPLDVADAAGIDRFAATLADELYAVDVPVSNAAARVAWAERAPGADLDAARAPLEVNLFGARRLVQAMVPLLRRSEAGRVVMVSSGAGSHADAASGPTAAPGTPPPTACRRRPSTPWWRPSRPKWRARASSSTPCARA